MKITKKQPLRSCGRCGKKRQSMKAATIRRKRLQGKQPAVCRLGVFCQNNAKSSRGNIPIEQQCDHKRVDHAADNSQQ